MAYKGSAFEYSSKWIRIFLIVIGVYTCFHLTLNTFYIKGEDAMVDESIYQCPAVLPKIVTCTFPLSLSLSLSLSGILARGHTVHSRVDARRLCQTYNALDGLDTALKKGLSFVGFSVSLSDL